MKFASLKPTFQTERGFLGFLLALTTLGFQHVFAILHDLVYTEYGPQVPLAIIL